MTINQWMQELKRSWEQHDIDAAVALFSDDVEYWESPGDLVNSDMLHGLWQDIRGCLDTTVTYDIYASDSNKHAVIWSATWHDNEGQIFNKGGTYLVSFNSDGKCSYFYRTSMEKNNEV